MGCNGPCQHVGLGRLYRTLDPPVGTPIALDFKGSERGSRLGPAANNGENIASGLQSFAASPLLLHHSHVL